MHKIKLTIFLTVLSLALFGMAGVVSADSDLFPPYENAPALTSYVSGGVFKHTYYISPFGNDATGDGSIGNPWATINGARTGGAGSPVVPGDIVYFRGGDYIATQTNIGWKAGYYYNNIDGLPTDYIIFTAYPGETPVFSAVADNITSLQSRAKYNIINGLTFTSGVLAVGNGVKDSQYNIIQNNIFNGDPYRADTGQINDTHLYLYDRASFTVVRNNYFSSIDAHSIKTYASDNMPTNIKLLYNRFYGGSVSYGLVAFKAAITNYEMAYNRFEGITSSCIGIGSSYAGDHIGLNIHHNAFDNCNSRIITKLNTDTTGPLVGLELHDNLIYNSTSGSRIFFEFDSQDGNMPVGWIDSMGEAYNNVVYDVVNLVDSETNINFGNYFSYWNYNAYPSTTTMATAENQNSLPASSWDGSSVIVANHGITRTGVAGNRFYSIPDTSPFRNSGRYGDAIGGFVWSTTLPDTTPPSVPQGLVVN